MIICICSNITDLDLSAEPELNSELGLFCGKCTENSSGLEHNRVSNIDSRELLELSVDEVRAS